MEFTKFQINEYRAKALSIVAEVVQSRIDCCRSSIESYKQQLEDNPENDYLHGWIQGEVEEKFIWEACMELLEKKLAK